MKSGAQTDGHHWRFCLSPAEAWDAMYQDCAEATRSIALEQYILADDTVGRKFMRLFTGKADQGLSIRLLCDGVGSRSLRHSPLVAELRAHGGNFHFYNSVKLMDLLKPRLLFPRTHVKTLVVDGAIAYVGGVCFDQEMEKWRDTQIRVTGPVVRQIEDMCDRNFTDARSSSVPGQRQDLDFLYVQSEPRFFRHPLYSALLHALGHAHNFIYISTAFFVPTRRLRRYLREAARRDVKVVVLIPEHSDSPIADWACLSYAGKLIRGGVRIFRYQPTVLHTKTALIDGTWGSVGSSNMDALSFFHNREANLVIKNREALAEMERDFLNDLAHSRELTLGLLRQIPLWKRIAMHLARLGRSFL